jgi:uncharacterized protein (DUF2141 family)
MKTFWMASLLYVIVIVLVLAQSTTLFAQTSGTIVVQMNGMKSDAGFMRVALFSKHDSFPGDKPFRGTTTPIKNHVAQCTFENVPFGEYAVSAFHDENANQKLDLGLFGPIEAYGFSNGARSFLPPPFDKAKVFFHERVMTATIEIR